MTKLNRRRFMQVASATGLAAILPAFPANALAASEVKTPAQMLWASLYSKAENATDFKSMAQSMGISENAANGVYSKLSFA